MSGLISISFKFTSESIFPWEIKSAAKSIEAGAKRFQLRRRARGIPSKDYARSLDLKAPRQWEK